LKRDLLIASRAAKEKLREEEERQEQVREHARSQSQCVPPEPTIDDGERKWASRCC
jgi:hypothetical protein